MAKLLEKYNKQILKHECTETFMEEAKIYVSEQTNI